MMRAQYLCHPDANNGANNMSRIDPPPGQSVSVADMEVRTARFKELKGSDLCFMDQRIPGHEREVILEAEDTVSVPVGIYRGFKNAGDTPATLHFIVGGPDTGKVHWHPSVIDAARETGLAADDNGLLVEIAAE
jgi:hypothetical protein